MRLLKTSLSHYLFIKRICRVSWTRERRGVLGLIIRVMCVSQHQMQPERFLYSNIPYSTSVSLSITWDWEPGRRQDRRNTKQIPGDEEGKFLFTWRGCSIIPLPVSPSQPPPVCFPRKRQELSSVLVSVRGPGEGREETHKALCCHLTKTDLQQELWTETCPRPTDCRPECLKCFNNALPPLFAVYLIDVALDGRIVDQMYHDKSELFIFF